MEDTSKNRWNKKTSKSVSIALLAHVDAGKTTLSEAMLYACGAIRKAGRVDHQDTFLDTDIHERQRGITIFSKQARMVWRDTEITLLDTPGHVDFSAEMERTLQVLDYAVLVVSGTDGVQGHTETLWKLLEHYQIPVFLFVNKMDLPGTDRQQIIKEMKLKLSPGCVDFTDTGSEEFIEEAAVCDEELLEKYLEQGALELPEDLRSLIAHRKLFPCCFGSALRLEGTEELLDMIHEYSTYVEREKNFGARVFKISRDAQGSRLTHIKITGGKLRVKEVLGEGEKVNQIRLYSGEKYETADEVSAGDICAVTGLNHTYPGQGLGTETDLAGEQLEPVLRYSILFPEGTDMTMAAGKLRQLEEEDPKLHLSWDESLHQMFIQPMGEVQLEVLKEILAERFGMEAEFGEGNILYKETIQDVVEGVGHFEPLRHYAEVHLLMEPLPPGSGIVVGAECSEDKLDLNWQRLVLTHLKEKEFAGVLTGSPITDMRITLVAGRAHLKHTEGGDFRQATYRAVRQGLMQARSVLLEPCYEFRMELPTENVGRAMTDIKRMCGEFEVLPEQAGMSVLTGICPVAAMKDYPVEFASYTKGRGHMNCMPGGYLPCHNEAEVREKIGYDAEADVENTPDSVFCAHGSGYVVKWNEVPEHMHLESVLESGRRRGGENQWKNPVSGAGREVSAESRDFYAEEEELQAIFERTYGAVKSRAANTASKVIRAKEEKQRVKIRERKPVEEYVLVDGYNIIFAWDDLKELSGVSMDAARMKLMDIMCNYQGYTGCHLILVFDAYKVKGNPGSVEQFHNISIVYTREAETADMYIEKTTKRIAGKHRVRVATSDGMEQIIILGHGATRMSAAAFWDEVQRVNSMVQN
ncbi:MAG: GTP-binding protein [Eubacterium sp.]|nr:GTP-binding protein [Eubacterium sp.]